MLTPITYRPAESNRNGTSIRTAPTVEAMTGRTASKGDKCITNMATEGPLQSESLHTINTSRAARRVEDETALLGDG